MNPGDLSLVLTFGFVSSLHCVQMCGPIVLSYSVAANAAQGRRSFLGLHLAYNAGRSITYMLLGMAAGFAGGAMGWVGQLAGFQNAAAIVAGTAMVLTGIAMFGFAPGLQDWRGFALPARFLRPAGKLIASPTPSAKFSLGLMMGFLPCGLIYAALMKAIGTASPVQGALTMLAFALGTSVALVVLGIGSSAVTTKVARWGTTVAALTVLIMGLVLIGRGAFAGSMTHHHMMHML
ncbi:sulfite exporter TauE/SafE family protein [Occallatibacter savannae]|uniref:sulfite exporter TauE/SafE family protein n=1 Tax=Occallatibacter savannae TaxID=1002691 RepID=UPI000D693A4B|nr:sulfite exporter TauE/SafE family protein [Occallatibacter savannae]